MAQIAIYPGSFDPPTLGHIDIATRAAGLFDEIIVAIGINTSKAPFLPHDARAAALEKCFEGHANVRVERFEGLLIDYARSRECRVLVRGLRAISDFEYEFRITMANRRLASEIETVFLVPSDENSFISSTVVREVAKLGGDVRPFVPGPVAELIEAQSR